MSRYSPKVVAVLPDRHVPEHDEAAVSCVERCLKLIEPDLIVDLGDFISGQSFSEFPKQKRAEVTSAAESFEEYELRPALAQLERLAEICPRIILLSGNHDARPERWCSKRGYTFLLDLVDPHRYFKAHLDANLRCIPWSTDRSCSAYYNITADLIAIHGWNAGKYAATRHLEAAAPLSVVHGHTHRDQRDSVRGFNTGRKRVAWSPGCLCQLQPVYGTSGSPTAWSHGFSLIYIGRSSWTDYTVSITDGQCVLPGGTQVSAKGIRQASVGKKL